MIKLIVMSLLVNAIFILKVNACLKKVQTRTKPYHIASGLEDVLHNSFGLEHKFLNFTIKNKKL